MNITKKDVWANEKQISALFGQDKDKTAKFLATAYEASQNKNIANCSPQSIMQSIVQTAQLDLSIDKNIGQAYIVPFKGQATLQVGYRGWVALLKRYGYDVKAYAVYSCDAFEYEINGWDEKLVFRPDFESREDDTFEWTYREMTGVMTLIRDSKTGEVYKEFTPKKLIEKLRLTGPGQNGEPKGVWRDWFAEMAMGKAIKRHAKKMPLEEGLMLQLREDDKREVGEVETIDMKTDKGKDLDNILLGNGQVADNETGEIVDAEETQAKEENKRGKLIAKLITGHKVSRTDAQAKVTELTKEEVAKYLDDPASVETLAVF